jgi:hypothetical protein
MLLRSGRHDDAEAALIESQEVARSTSQHAYDAETLRLWGELCVRRDDVNRAHDFFRRAMDDAEGRDARWLNFRAAQGLSQLLLNQDRSSEVLRPALSSVAVNSSCVEVMVATELVSLLENRSSDAGVVLLQDEAFEPVN